MVSRSPRRSLPLLCSFVLLATLASAAAAQPAFQAKDINTSDKQRTGVSERMAILGGELFFTQGDGVYGVELWKTDGTPGNAFMLKDLCPGACSSHPRALTRVGPGNVVAWPAGMTVPNTSNVNFMAGSNRANSAILEMNDGQIQALARMAPGGTVHFIVDVVGYFH